MGRHKMTKGICNICGIKTNLSYEHVPPKAAFNKNTKYVSIKFEDYIQSRNLMKEIPKGKTKQGGIGYNSFCEKCNNFFGANYVNAYVKWVNAGVQLLADSEFASCYFEIKNIEPLSILKQIISMFLAINDNSFSNDFKELSEFVINKESKILPEKFQIYTYLTRAERLRYMKYSAIGDLNTRQTVLCSEMAYPPFGYVLTIDSKINKKYLRNITEFKNYDFNENKDFIMSLAQLPTYTIYSLDYRSKDKLNNDIEKANNLMDNIDKFRKENS
ncbi:hypothetical protein KLA_11600 [Cellulophaga geojensis KL-A]|uniref:HNH endonuclease 5 domain-containing protein n=1 Tax=Cellulophaga geojensis KL-A TaxID=1328323 RepID=A0ABP3B6P6_9FLAO|nr:hypothetical protein [Cellulophaga geojensis]EWH12977.1 hypothetical protein KLA_11600 [Cellulophaga geojensis KL-A]